VSAAGLLAGAGLVSAVRFVAARRFPGEGGPAVARVDVREVRAYLRRVLTGTGVDLGDAELPACEVVTNAVRHTDSGKPGGRVWVTVIVTDEGVRVEVTDEGGTSTEPHVPSAAALSGRGLLIVQELAKRWGWGRDGDGRVTVWFELAATGARHCG